MDHLDISIEDTRWNRVPFLELAQTAVSITLKYLNLPPETAEISLLACDDAQITNLNADFRDKPKATNVLSWPSEERAAMSPGTAPIPPQHGPDGLMALGDIAVSFETCQRESEAASKPLSDHVTHLIVHGTLHLLGYDHETEPDAALMEGLEVKILGKLGLDDPYRKT